MFNFGNEWFGIPCSRKYWDAVKPVFDRLKSEKAAGEKWSERTDKENAGYVPMLQAFMDEMDRMYKIDSSMPKKMVECLIRTSDDSEIVCRDGKSSMVVHALDAYRTLNRPGEIKEPSISIPEKTLPTELIAFKFKTNSRNTVEMYLNNGWQLEFRIQDTDAGSEQDFKLDARLIGIPSSIANIEWR